MSRSMDMAFTEFEPCPSCKAAGPDCMCELVDHFFTDDADEMAEISKNLERGLYE